MRGVGGIAMRFERSARGFERLRCKAEIARSQRNLRLRNDATCASERFSNAERTRRGTQQLARAAVLPSCASAMPRRARPAASLRSATSLSAPIGSPAASARAPADISESMAIASHLSLSSIDAPRRDYVCQSQLRRRIVFDILHRVGIKTPIDEA